MSIGGPEIIVLFLLALIVFGPRKLPEIGRSLGQAMRELRRMSSEVTSVFEDALDDRRRAASYGQEWQHPEDGSYHSAGGGHTGTEDSPSGEAEDPYAGVYAGEDVSEAGPGAEEGTESAPVAPGFREEGDGETAAERTD